MNCLDLGGTNIRIAQVANGNVWKNVGACQRKELPQYLVTLPTYESMMNSIVMALA